MKPSFFHKERERGEGKGGKWEGGKVKREGKLDFHAFITNKSMEFYFGLVCCLMLITLQWSTSEEDEKDMMQRRDKVII